MRINWSVLSVLVPALLLSSGVRWAAASDPARQSISIIGTIKQAAPDRNSAVFAGADGQSYLLDLSGAKIAPGSKNSPLAPGTPVTVFGSLTGDRSIAVSRLLLPAAPKPPAVLPTVPGNADPLDLTVRGTVEAINLGQGSFVLRVGSHTRMIYVTADTSLSGLGPQPAGQFAVQPGRRVTVGGALQPNGTVLAGLLTAKEDVDYHTALSLPNRILFGIVSSPANKFGRRDIKIRAVNGGGAEAKVAVPRGIPIRRNGAQISMYDLSRRDQVRVTGRMSGPDLQAARIDVLAPSNSAATAAEPSAAPARP